MQAEYFSSGGDSVLGLYHRPEGTLAERTAGDSSMAVLICPPFGQEAIRSHKCLSLLAHRLTRQGVHVMRFAFRGTDDSSLWSDEILSLQDWRQDIVAAKAELKRLSGCSSVMLLGLRLGANLAVDVARDAQDVHSVVLWEPIYSGSEYVRTLRKNQREMIDLWHGKVTTQDTEEIEELFSSRYQRCLLSEIEQVRLETHPLQQPTLVVSALDHLSKSSPDIVIAREAMEKHIVSGEPDGWQELDQLETVWWRPQAVNKIVAGAQEMFSRVEACGWHRQYATGNNQLANSYHELPPATPTEALSLAASSLKTGAQLCSTVSESLVQFGHSSRLTGVFTEPADRIPGSPVMIMLNAGIVHRVGPFRLHVNIARTLAQHGIASLRLDLSGLGDSQPRTGQLTKDERVQMDISEAMDYLNTRGCGNNFVLCGLCSGAYHAHQAAMADPRVVGAVFLDGIVFRTAGYYFRHHFLRLFRLRFWRNAIKRRWLKALRKNQASASEEGNKLAEAEYFQVNRSRPAIAAELQTLQARSTQMLFVYTGDYDDVCGRSQFQEMFDIAPSPQVQVDYMATASHTFRLVQHRHQLCQRLAAWMKSRFRG